MPLPAKYRADSAMCRFCGISWGLIVGEPDADIRKEMMRCGSIDGTHHGWEK